MSSSLRLDPEVECGPVTLADLEEAASQVLLASTE